VKRKQSITPGPWRTGDMFNTVFGPKTDAPCPEVIATIHKGNRANAQAIAALPDLIEALQAAKDRLETLSDADEATDNDLEVLADIGVALRKAGING
jgi:hypothetical protein